MPKTEDLDRLLERHRTPWLQLALILVILLALVHRIPADPRQALMAECAYRYAWLETRADTNALDADPYALELADTLGVGVTCGELRRAGRMPRYLPTLAGRAPSR
jgi:hypothetical protein